MTKRLGRSVTKWWPKGAIFWRCFVYLWGAGASNLGHFRALETPGGDLGPQGSILGPWSPRNTTFWAPVWAEFRLFWGMFLRCSFGRPPDHVFDYFGMVPGSSLGSVS